MGALSIRDITKSFGALNILKGIDIDIDIEVEAGEFLILVGPSGGGKSTLLSMIAGLDLPSGGEILIGDRDVTYASPRDRDIAMVFQNYALYPNVNVAQNIAFGLEMRKVPRAQREAGVQRVTKMLKMEHLLERKPGQLSGGQRQRVAMGGHWRATRRCCCSTSRCLTSTPSCASRCARRSSCCTSARARRPSTSRTTRSRR